MVPNKSPNDPQVPVNHLIHKDGKGYWKSLSDYNLQRNWPLLNIIGCFESKKEARAAAVDATFHAMKTEGVINPRDSLFKMRQAQSNVDSKSWPGRREQLLHYRIIGTLPESQKIAHAVAKQSRKRIAPTPVVGHRWLLNECGNLAAFPIVESIMMIVLFLLSKLQNPNHLSQSATCHEALGLHPQQPSA